MQVKRSNSNFLKHLIAEELPNIRKWLKVEYQVRPERKLHPFTE